MPAPKGNKYALGNKGGRPPIFKTAEDIQKAIDKYFNKGVKKRKIVIGKALNSQVIEIEVPTITGLCYYIGFESRQSFYRLEDKEEFKYTIKRARLFIEREYEEQLSYGNTTGAIFALKNMGWFDRQELSGVDGKDLNPHIVIELIDSSDRVESEEEKDSSSK